MKSVITVLDQEHRLLKKVIELMSGIARDLDAGHECEPSLLDGIVQFMRIFGEQCHHGKEEKALFTLLEARGVPVKGCPIAALVGEHRRAHEMLDQLEAVAASYRSGDKSARSALLASLKSLVDLYRQHIWKEEYLLFPMMSKVLAAPDYEQLAKEFAEFESEIGFDVHHAMEAMVDSIGRQKEDFVERESLPVPECSVCGS